ncbi:MAG: hypothetical protein OHK0054_10630 [Sideroxydans sp.]
MQNELNALEHKLTQLVELTRHLRAENQQLRQQVAHALNQQHKSQDKIEQAAARLERLLQQLPPDTP